MSKLGKFVGGFARSLYEQRLEEKRQQQELARQEAMIKLQKRFDFTWRLEGDKMVKYNGLGEKIDERWATEDELRDREVDRAKDLDAIDEATTGKARRALDTQLKQEDQQIQREQLEISRGHLGVARSNAATMANRAKDEEKDAFSYGLLQARKDNAALLESLFPAPKKPDETIATDEDMAIYNEAMKERQVQMMSEEDRIMAVTSAAALARGIKDPAAINNLYREYLRTKIAPGAATRAAGLDSAFGTGILKQPYLNPER